MLQKLFKYGGKILVTIMLGLLVLSFAFWGIGDVMRGGSSDAVAVVGELEIPEREFRNLLQQEVSKLRANFGEAMTPELIKSFNVEKRIISQLVNDRLLTLAAREMNVIVGNGPALKEVASIPQFRTSDGSFNSEAFRQFLASQRESEAGFIARLKNNLARNALMDTLAASPIIPTDVVEQVYKYDNEKRMAELILVPGDYIEQVREPQESELIEFYEKEKIKFSAPEYRSFSYILLNNESVNAGQDITEQDIKIAYGERVSDFATPEKREILHIIFNDSQSAATAHEDLKSGKDFFAVAEQHAGQDRDETNLGLVTTEDLLEEIAQSAFRIDEDDYSEPIESSLGWHIVKVKDIVKAQVKPLSEVAEQIRKDLIDNKTDETIYTLSTALEDALAGGTTLEEAAAGLDLKLSKAGPLTEQGEPKSTTQKVKIPSYENFLPTVFASSEGGESDLVRSPDNKGYFIIRVDEIILARAKALDEVKGRAVQEWKEKTKRDLRISLASLASKKLNEVASSVEKVKLELSEETEEMKQMKAKTKGAIKTRESVEVNRFSNIDNNIPANLVTEIFSIKKGESTDYYEDKDKSLVVAKLKEIVTVGEDADTAKLDETRLALTYSFADDIWEQYLTYLRFKYPVKIFEEKISSE